MGVSVLLEKLINEHGSAVILKERVSSLKDQIIELENENKSFQSENAVLNYKIKKLESEKSKIEEKNRICQNRLHEVYSVSISEKHQNVLVTVASYSGQPAAIFAERLKLTEGEVMSKLNYLSSLDFLHYREITYKDKSDPNGRYKTAQIWFVSKPGHIHMKANNLIDKIV